VTAMPWRASLDRALAANDIQIDDLRHVYVDEGSPVPAWLAQLQDGTLESLSAAQYLALADLTGIEVDVLNGAIDPERTLSVAMRSRGQTAPRHVLERATQLLGAAAKVMRLDDYVARRERLNGIQRDARPGPVAADHPTRRAGEQAALRFRAARGLGTEPILDLVAIIEDHGVAVELSRDLPSKLHGVTAWNLGAEGWTAVMVVNALDLWTVQRYTIAHEFSHVLHEDRPEDLTTELVDAIGSDPTEQRAEAFASQLLIPSGGLRNFWNSERLGEQDRGIAVGTVMWHFGVSRQAACIALCNCPQIAWTEEDTSAVRGVSVNDLMRRAGLWEEWSQMDADQGVAAPSAWLSEATSDLFLSGRLPVENYATVANLPAEAALASLTGAAL